MRLLFIFTLLAEISVKTTVFAQNVNISNGYIFDGEPYLVIDPNDNAHLVIAWMSWTITQQVVIKTKVSFNGGETWTTSNPLPHTQQGYTSADVSMAFDKNGVLYLSYIDYQKENNIPVAGAVFLSKSYDGGITWTEPVEIINGEYDGGKLPIDRPWIAVNENSNVFVVSTNAKNIPSPNHPYFSFSYDSGQSFSNRYLDTTGWLAGSYIKQPMATIWINDENTIYTAYPSYVPEQNPYGQFILAISRNSGQSFEYKTIFTLSSSINDSLAKIGYKIMCDPSNHSHLVFLYLTKSYGDLDVAMRESYDEGETWTEEYRINDDPPGNNKMQDLVWADFDEDGDLVITWRDRRNGDDTTYASSYEIYATYRMHDSSEFVPNFRISDTIIPFDTILNYSGNDFMCVKVRNDTTYAVWGDTRNGKMNIWLSKFVIGTPQSIQQIKIAEEPIMYPVPANDKIFLQNTSATKAEILTIDGKTVKKEYFHYPSNTISVSGVKEGIYIIKITDINGNIFYKQIIIK